MSILQELWYGNIRPNEDKVITDEEKELVSLIARHHETLSSSLKNMLSLSAEKKMKSLNSQSIQTQDSQ